MRLLQEASRWRLTEYALTVYDLFSVFFDSNIT